MQRVIGVYCISSLNFAARLQIPRAVFRVLETFMEIEEATTRYEHWLRRLIVPVEKDLQEKHRMMRENRFAFLRATVYRWEQVWRRHAGDLASAPTVLAVGDLHVENFGTWRDSEGRLVWGVNDFDEAVDLPYTADLVRLATSISVAIADTSHFNLSFEDACSHLLEGYTTAIRMAAKNGSSVLRPFVLAEEHDWLRGIASRLVKDPDDFWDKQRVSRTVPDRKVPIVVRQCVADRVPAGASGLQWKRRCAGLGSLGRPRFVALAEWRGGLIAREAKAVVPSAWLWDAPGTRKPVNRTRKLLAQAVRCPDPVLTVAKGWVVRRLAPDCIKLDLGDLDHLLPAAEADYMRAMGRETANVHAGTETALAAIAKHLKQMPDGWLSAAGRRMAEFVMADWKEWRQTK